MARRYFTLVSRDRDTGRWGIEFGDYDRDCVIAERQDYLDSAEHKFRAANLRIIATPNAQQVTIDAAVAKLNSEKPALWVGGKWIPLDEL